MPNSIKLSYPVQKKIMERSGKISAWKVIMAQFIIIFDTRWKNPSPLTIDPTDVKIGSVNDMLTYDRNLRIGRHKLKIAGEYPNIGVWFVN